MKITHGGIAEGNERHGDVLPHTEGSAILRRMRPSPLLSALLFLAAAARAASPVGAEASFPEPGRAEVALDLPAGHDLYLDSLRVSLEPGGAALAPDALPAAAGEDELGRAFVREDFSLSLALPSPLPPGAELAVAFQACGPEMCFPPETRRFPVPGAAPSEDPAAAPEDAAPTNAAPLRLPGLGDMTVLYSAAGYLGPEEYLALLRGDYREADFLERARARGGIALLLLALLAGGFLLNLTPCVLPLVPVNLALLGAGTGRATRRRGLALGAAFGLGTAVAFGALGLFSALTGRAFGELHASPVFHAAVALVFCALALAMLDVLRIDFSSLRNRIRRRRGPGAAAGAAAPGAGGGLLPLARAFAAGAGSALLAGACVAPVLVSALVLAANLVGGGHPAGALVPFALGLGMGLPWPFLGAGLAALPKPGAWMNRVKQLFALVFLAAAAVYAAQAWRLLFPTVRKAPLAGPVEWMSDEAAAAIVAEKAQGPLVLDLTADWCRACREMDETTFADPDVAEELSRFPARLRLDCTDADDPAVRRAMEIVGAPGLPFSAVLAPRPAKAGAEPR